MQLTPNFSLEEFTRSTIAMRRGIDNSPSPAILANLRVTALGLEQVRAIALRGRPIHLMSGYRCPALNTAVRGSATSEHMTGLAADIASPGLSAMGLAAAIRDSGLAFDQLILETSRSVVHVGFGLALRREILTQREGAGTPFERGLVA